MPGSAMVRRVNQHRTRHQRRAAISRAHGRATPELGQRGMGVATRSAGTAREQRNAFRNALLDISIASRPPAIGPVGKT